MFWGFSEPLDLLNEYEKITGETPTELNILLYGGGDPRHIMKTLASTYLHPTTKLHFYVSEGCLEILARNMLLLSICLEQSNELSLRGKTHMFMDIYGNTLLRPTSYTYICSKALHFDKAITDNDYANKFMPIFDFNQLKFRERDGLENIFHFWRPKKENIFAIDKYWEQRVRQDLGTRYDSRHGVFDWDLQMKLRDYGAQQICPQEYKNWRDIGVAFVFPEYEHTFPNKTLAAGLVRNGSSFRHRGYVGDISIGPFGTFGIKCDDESMLTSSHGTNRFRSTDVTERNVFQLMYEIQENEKYDHQAKDSHEFGASVLQISKPLSATLSVQSIEESELKKFNNSLIIKENISVSFMTIDDVLKVQSRPQFQQYFDVVFVAQNYFTFLKDNFKSILAEKAAVIFETKQLSILRKENISEELTKIKNYAKGIDLEAVTSFNLNIPMPVIRYKNI